jgi:hypothetical protein
MRVGATLRGVEVTAEGRLERSGDRLLLRMDGTGEVVALEPARRTIFWNVARKRARRLTSAERSACSRMQSQWRDRPVAVRVTGPLVRSGAGTSVLEVRTFTWIR